MSPCSLWPRKPLCSGRGLPPGNVDQAGQVLQSLLGKVAAEVSLALHLHVEVTVSVAHVPALVLESAPIASSDTNSLPETRRPSDATVASTLEPPNQESLQFAHGDPADESPSSSSRRRRRSTWSMVKAAFKRGTVGLRCRYSW